MTWNPLAPSHQLPTHHGKVHTLHSKEQGGYAFKSYHWGLLELKEDFLHPPAGSADEGLRSFHLFINIQQLVTVRTGRLCFDVCLVFCLHQGSDYMTTLSPVEGEEVLSMSSKSVRLEPRELSPCLLLICSRAAAGWLLTGFLCYAMRLLTHLQKMISVSLCGALKAVIQGWR